jgi:hypothetical protein
MKPLLDAFIVLTASFCTAFAEEDATPQKLRPELESKLALADVDKTRFKLSITVKNVGSRVLNISTYGSWKPLLIDSNRKVCPFNWGRDSTIIPNAYDFRILKPGQVTLFAAHGMRQKLNNGMVITITDRTGGMYWSEPLNAGKYSMALVGIPPQLTEGIRRFVKDYKQLEISADSDLAVFPPSNWVHFTIK